MSEPQETHRVTDVPIVYLAVCENGHADAVAAAGITGTLIRHACGGSTWEDLPFCGNCGERLQIEDASRSLRGGSGHDGPQRSLRLPADTAGDSSEPGSSSFSLRSGSGPRQYLGRADETVNFSTTEGRLTSGDFTNRVERISKPRKRKAACVAVAAWAPHCTLAIWVRHILADATQWVIALRARRNDRGSTLATEAITRRREVAVSKCGAEVCTPNVPVYADCRSPEVVRARQHRHLREPSTAERAEAVA